MITPPSSRRLLRTLGAILLFACVAHSGAVAQTSSAGFTAGRVEPVDESQLDPSFASFWKEFSEVVARRDLPGLARIVAEDIYWSFALEEVPGPTSRERFLASWQQGGLDDLWFELQHVIDAGGVFDRNIDGTRASNSFEFPSACVRFAVSGGYDRHIIAIRAGVRVFAAPWFDSAVLARVDYAVLRAAPAVGQVSQYWYRVHAGPDTFGFVHERDVCRPLGYRGRFARTPEGWKLVTFVTGEPG